MAEQPPAASRFVVTPRSGVRLPVSIRDVPLRETSCKRSVLRSATGGSCTRIVTASGEIFTYLRKLENALMGAVYLAQQCKDVAGYPPVPGSLGSLRCRTACVLPWRHSFPRKNRALSPFVEPACCVFGDHASFLCGGCRNCGPGMIFAVKEMEWRCIRDGLSRDGRKCRENPVVELQPTAAAWCTLRW